MTSNKLKILLTGGTGFLGSIIYNTLHQTHEVVVLSRSYKADIIFDLSEGVPTVPDVDMVVHNAGLAHMLSMNQEDLNCFTKVNVEGTQNLLEALEYADHLPATIILISTVAVYGVDKGTEIHEQHVPNPKSPYAKSKLQAESLVLTWCERKSVSAIILRLPLVVGPHPKGNLAALLQAIKKRWYVEIAQNSAPKSAVLAHDIANLIPHLYQKTGIYNLSDGSHPSLNDIARAITVQLGRKISLKLPLYILQIAAIVGDFLQKIHLPFPFNSIRLTKMTSSLTFSDKKAQNELDWKPTPVIEWLKTNPL